MKYKAAMLCLGHFLHYKTHDLRQNSLTGNEIDRGVRFLVRNGRY